VQNNIHISGVIIALQIRRWWWWCWWWY